MKLAAIILLTVVVRVVYCLAVYPVISKEASLKDASLQGHDRYDDIARNLLSGSGYSIDASGQPTMRRLPLYPLLIYLTYATLGTHLWALQMVQVVLAGVTAWLIFLIGRALFSDTVGLLAASLFALHPHLIQYTARPYTETLYVLLICLLGYLLLDVPGAAPRKNGLIAGVVFGLTLLTKGVAIWFPVLFFLGWLLDSSHRKPLAPVATYLLCFLIGAAATVSPWVYRNYALTGKVILAPTTEGGAFYHGLYVSSHLGDGRTPGALDRAASEERRRVIVEQHGPIRQPIDEYHYSRLAYTLAFRKLLHDPLRTGTLFLRNLFLVWFLTRTTFFTSLGLLIHLPLLGLSLYGLIWLLRQDRKAFGKTWAICSLIIYFTVVYAIAYPFVRYVLPVAPLVMILASFGLVKLFKSSESFRLHSR